MKQKDHKSSPVSICSAIGLLLCLGGTTGCYSLPVGGDIRVRFLLPDSPADNRRPCGVILPYFRVWRGGMFPQDHFDMAGDSVRVTTADPVVHFPHRTGHTVLLDWPLNIGTIHYCGMLVLVDGYWPKVLEQELCPEGDRRVGVEMRVAFRDESSDETGANAVARSETHGRSTDHGVGRPPVVVGHLTPDTKKISEHDLVRLVSSWGGIRKAIGTLKTDDRRDVNRKLLQFSEVGLEHRGTEPFWDLLESISNELRSNVADCGPGTSDDSNEDRDRSSSR